LANLIKDTEINNPPSEISASQNFYLILIIDLIRKLHSNQNQEKSEEFIELRHSIENRIEELEDFFEDNFDNEFIFFFERGRYKLKNCLCMSLIY